MAHATIAASSAEQTGKTTLPKLLLVFGAIALVTCILLSPRGTIHRHETLISKYGRIEGLVVASRLHLPIYRGKWYDSRRERVNLIQALMTNTRHQQLFVPVYPGDSYHFDVFLRPHFIPARGHSIARR